MGIDEIIAILPGSVSIWVSSWVSFIVRCYLVITMEFIGMLVDPKWVK